MKTKLLKILAYIRKKNIIENILLIGAIISANFAAYLSYYDINALVITDTSALIQYISSFTILFVVVSTSISVILLFIQKFFLLLSDEKGYLSRESREFIHNVIGNKAFKFISTTVVFLFFYTGLNNTIIIIVILLAYMILLITFDILFRLEDSNIMQKGSFLVNVIYLLKVGFSTNFNYKKTFSNIYQGHYIQFLLSKVGIMLILFSLALGASRATYVENHILVKINEDKKTFVLYLSTSNGICLYDITQQEVSFVSWGNVKNLVFLSEKRRSIDKFVKRIKNEK